MSTAAETRKTVTVLFCDVTGSTELGERLDPETLRHVLLRYWEEMRGVLERHGGTVEKFIGDAVVGVFGVPAVHEDDALRAVRAGAEMRARIEELNEELERSWGVRLEVRIGINTGEVVAGEGGTLVTGDTVNVAARLQQSAEPRQILIGDDTHRLVGHAVRALPLDERALKGRRTGVRPWVVEEIRPDASTLAARADTPLVGRSAELAALREAYERAISAGRAELATVVGHAGIGKSRLAREFVDRLEEDRVAVGRCLAYGDGITFWPIREIVRTLAGIGGGEGADSAQAKIKALVQGDAEADLVCERVSSAVGLGETTAAAPEVFWALRRLFEAAARIRPLVLVIEDIHWAERTLLDFLEYVADWTVGTPILLLCLARPELSDVRPAWPVTLTLDRLDPSETRELIGNVVGAGAGDAVAARVTQVAEGNPLFVEELLWMLIEEGSLRPAGDGFEAAGELDTLQVPPTISALLAARLDRLSNDERDVIQRAAVVGKQFWWSAVAELSPSEKRPDVGAHLHALVRKKLIRPDEPTTFADEDTFRFGHILIRDAAYQSLPKQQRGELHERFADCLQLRAGVREAEYEEIIGYHLEQAYRARVEVAPVDERARSLARRASTLLGSAGRKAFARDDMPAAIALLDRAMALMTDQDPARFDLARELSTALWWAGEVARAESLLNGLIEAGAAADDPRHEWYGLVERAARKNLAGSDTGPEELLRVAKDAVRVFERLDDDFGLARAWRRIAHAQLTLCRFGEAERASEQALLHAQRAADTHEEARIVDALCTSLLYGPAPAEHATERCRRMLSVATGSRLMEASVAIPLAGLCAMRGAFDEARMLAARAEEIYDELGLRLAVAGLTQIAGPVEVLAGDLVAAERYLRRGYEILDGISSTGYQASLLADVLSEQGRWEEAERFAAIAETSAGDDLAALVLWRAARAKVAAHHGRAQEALELARAAERMAGETDALNLQADVFVCLATILGVTGSPDEADLARREAVSLYRRKGNVVSAERANRELAATVR